MTQQTVIEETNQIKEEIPVKVEEGKIRTSDGKDLTELLRDVMASNSKIDFVGCQTGRGESSIAQETSKLLPNVDVTGSRNFTLSSYQVYGYRIGLPIRLRTWKTFRNGQR